QLGLRAGAGHSAAEPHDNLQDLAAQVESDWALHLGAVWGLRTDGERVALLEARAQELHAAYVERFAEVGFYRAGGKRGYTKDTCAVARATAAAYGGSGVCAACRGSGHVLEPCRGVKERGRFQGCPVLDLRKVGSPFPASCPVCQGAGDV